MIVISFLGFLLGFVFIGGLSIIKHKATTNDYLMAGRSVAPWLVSLSAVATNNSGYMFIGMIGFTFVEGISSLWLMVGWISGDLIMSLFVHRRLREKSGELNAMSYGTVLSRWHGKDQPWVRLIAGMITIIFLGTYAAAQLKAGSKALYVLFGWNYSVGAVIGASIVLLYCFAGGIRASIWTDAAQSFVMVLAMLLLLVFGLFKIGSFSLIYAQLQQVSPHYLDLFSPKIMTLGVGGAILFLLGWLFAGFGVIGQPHIMVRFMVMQRKEDMSRIRWYYYSWYTLFYLLTIGVGLLARLLAPDLLLHDQELALPLLALQLMPAVLVGLVLAGLFAATMSTADSQILSCTAAITQDFGLQPMRTYWVTKIVTVIVCAVALFIALTGSDSVFQLVLIAWGALACSFAPLLVVLVLGGHPSQLTAVLMMLTGLLVMAVSRQLGISSIVYEIFPGMMTGFLPYLVQLMIHRPLCILNNK